MSNPKDDLNEQILALQRSLVRPSAVHTDLTQKYLEFLNDEDSIEKLCALYNYLNLEENLEFFSKAKKRKLIEDINLNILLLIRNKLAIKYEVELPEIPHKTRHTRAGLFIGIAILCTLLAGVDGASIAEGIVGTFVNFGSFPSVLLIPLQFIFAITSVAMFCGFELHSIAKPLGVGIFGANGVVKSYARQTQTCGEIFDLIQDVIIKKDLPKAQLNLLENNYVLIKEAYKNLENKVSEVRHVQNHPPKWKSRVQTAYGIVTATVCGFITSFLASGTISSSLLPLILGVGIASGPIGLGITLGLAAIFFIGSALIYKKFHGKRASKEFVNKISGTPSNSVKKITANDQTIKRKLEQLDIQLPEKQERLDEKERKKARINIKGNHPPSDPVWVKQETNSPSPSTHPNRFLQIAKPDDANNNSHEVTQVMAVN